MPHTTDFLNKVVCCVLASLCINYVKWFRTTVAGADQLALLARPKVLLPGCSSFEKLRSVREMEYELDFVTNRASRDTQVWPAAFAIMCTATQ